MSISQCYGYIKKETWWKVSGLFIEIVFVSCEGKPAISLEINKTMEAQWY